MTAPRSLEVRLEDIQECFQGIIPSVICSVSGDGWPNVTNLSIVQRVDEHHVALSRQFFNKTVRNLASNPRLQALVVEPSSGRQFRLDLMHEATQSDGQLFDRMAATLQVVASQSGMSDVFRLRGIDLCRVIECRQVPSDRTLTSGSRTRPGTNTLVEYIDRMESATDVDSLIVTSLQAFDELFGLDRSIMLSLDESAQHLYTVASHGFEISGAGAEVHFGVGVIGVAAQRGRPVRVGNLRRDRLYAEAMRSSLKQAPEAGEKAIELPRLGDVLSELAVPIMARDRLLGVLGFQSEVAGRFTAEDEDMASVIGRQMGLAMELLRLDSVQFTADSAHRSSSSEGSVAVKHYAEDDSIFIDNSYIIKGVAGRLLWRLLQMYSEQHRTEFTNREFRLDPSLDLPGYKDNLETRLILLRRRLEDRSDALRIISTGRGRFRLSVAAEVRLQEA